MSRRAQTRRQAPADGPPTTATNRPRPRRPERRTSQPSRLRTWALPSFFLVAGLAAIAIVALAVTSPSAAGDVKASRSVLG